MQDAGVPGEMVGCFKPAVPTSDHTHSLVAVLGFICAVGGVGLSMFDTYTEEVNRSYKLYSFQLYEEELERRQNVINTNDSNIANN